jgi:branched-chain amino acid transport system substrate-binding protein
MHSSLKWSSWIAAGLLGGIGFQPVVAADDGPITFLAAVILSGPFKATDVQNLEGVRFAIDELNAAGGVNRRPIKLEVVDTELNAAATKRKTADAVLKNNVKAIIGASGSDVLKALIAVGQQYHVPVIAFAGETDELTGSEFQPALFRVASNTTMHAAGTVYAAIHTYPDIKKVFLLNEDYSFGRASAVGFERALKRLAPNVEIVGNVFHPRGAANFSPYLQQIQASEADFVLTADWGADLVQLVNQAKRFNLKPRIGGTFLADPEILKGVGDAAIGDIGSDVYLPTLDNELNRGFVLAWHAAHANTDLPWPTASIGKSYISTKLAASAIAAADSTDFDKVEKVLEGFKTDSIAGPLEVRACDHQIQLPQVAGVVVPADKKYYDFPYLGPALLAPLSAIAVPPVETGNPRCKTS